MMGHSDGGGGAGSEAAAATLDAGIAAAKAGDHGRARRLLKQVVAHEHDNLRAWLWLSSVMTSPEEQIHCLEQVLRLAPDHPQARKALSTLTVRESARWLDAGITAAERGDPAHARELLMRVVEHDEENVRAWWWLSQVVPTEEDQIICLENVLALDPTHAPAQLLLSELRPEAPPPIIYEEIETEPAPEWDAYIEGDVDQTKYEASVPIAALDRLPEMLTEPLNCPYCAAPTEYRDRRCPICDRSLWSRTRELPDPTRRYALLLAQEGIYALIALLLPTFLLIYLSALVDVDNYLDLLPIYGGWQAIPPEVAEALFGLLSKFTFWLATVPALIAVLILLMLLPRWHKLFFGALGLSGLRILLLLMLLGVIVNMISENAPARVSLFLSIMHYLTPITALILFGGAVAAFIFLLRTEEEFEMDVDRIMLQIDSGIVDSEMGLRIAGRRAAKRRMWALAALHLRRALGLNKRLETTLMLVMAYINLEEYDLAEDALTVARQLGPDVPQVTEMMALLKERAGQEIGASVAEDDELSAEEPPAEVEDVAAASA
jgi:Tfp pilus assembly protein PilF